jgi:ribosomal protein S18 acetylase RimI-like enzyme
MRVTLRGLRSDDRARLQELLQATGAFTGDEVDVALELIDAGETAAADSYRFVVAADARDVALGYACYGLAPMTDGVFDLYWIAVDPAAQRGGVGRALLGAVEERVRELAGRLVLIETASKPSYAATRAFYQRAGYVELARIRDYYRAGDDKIVYGRRVTSDPPQSTR